jgi:hypothetical protein
MNSLIVQKWTRGRASAKNDEARYFILNRLKRSRCGGCIKISGSTEKTSEVEVINPIFRESVLKASRTTEDWLTMIDSA